MKIAGPSLSLSLTLLAGCAGFMSGGRQESAEDVIKRPHVASSIDVTLVNRCPRPVDVCYGEDSCVTLAAGARRAVTAATDGFGTIFVRFRGAPKGEFADATFAAVEVEEGCSSLRRRLTAR